MRKGIINTIQYAREISGVSKDPAVIGGFHLINTRPEIIQKTVSDVAAIHPDFIAPAHCTGFEAIVARSARKCPINSYSPQPEQNIRSLQNRIIKINEGILLARMLQGFGGAMKRTTGAN